MEVSDTALQPSGELYKTNSLKVITNFCKNLQSLVDNPRDIATTAQKQTSIPRRIKRISLNKRWKRKPVKRESDQMKNTQASTTEGVPMRKIELVLMEETVSEGGISNKCSNIKQELEDCNKAIVQGFINLDSEESTNLLELINCKRKGKCNGATCKKENLHSGEIMENLTDRTQKRVNLETKPKIGKKNISKEDSNGSDTFTLSNTATSCTIQEKTSQKRPTYKSTRDTCESNSDVEEDNNKNTPDSAEFEESDDLQEFLNAVEPKKSKYKPRRKRQLTEEQQAEKERKKLERRTCTICSTVFAFPGGLRNHIRSKHTLEKPYSCEFCGEQFSIQGSYALHKRRHLGIKPHLCNLCGKTFLRKMDMHIHMQIHVPLKDKMRDVKCSYCSNRYTSKINLRKHMLTKHTDPSEWKHECSICGKKCFSATDLTHHIRQHNDDRKFKCVICGRGFFTKQSMNVHVRTHSASTAFNCQHCSNGYRSNEALQRHMLKVHGIGEKKPISAPTYFCSTCKEGFRQRARLEQHLILHETGKEEYPFECKQCDKRYKARNYFTIHMMEKHNVFIDDDYFKTHFKSSSLENCTGLDDTTDVPSKNSHNEQVIGFNSCNSSDVEYDGVS